ncbi:Hypothetical predicted protein [Octopus vulgaris]|uniref:Uncharacterized protein n=1 Tax=Octopus vulgaris TaxID=6645 RepID=A0AA36AY33_OCTVU|nr:Hypothetical predicted protein [Octopus vulgaris]
MRLQNHKCPAFHSSNCGDSLSAAMSESYSFTRSCVFQCKRTSTHLFSNPMSKSQTHNMSRVFLQCHNTPMASAVSCRQFIHMLPNQTELTFPQLNIQDNITIAQTDLVKIALSNMSATLSQYVTVLKNQTEKEYDQLCAPAKRIQTECHYPAACSKLTPTSDAIFYCYLKQTLSYLVDTILFLDSPIFSNIKQNVEVDDSLLLPDDVPITKQRWFTIITLHTLHENINHIQNTLQSFM